MPIYEFECNECHKTFEKLCSMKEDLTQVVEREYNTLVEASKHVEPGGELIYFVTTFCNDECRKMTKKFLKEHEEYEFITEKQMFPFDKYQTLLYFSVFKRKDK